jgi:hypothetical protein
VQLFRKLSLSNLKSQPGESVSECKAKYKPQKNHSNSITLSPLNGPIQQQPSIQRKRTSSRKKDHRKHKTKSVDDELEDDFTVPSTSGKHRRSYIKNCIKKRLNNNYEKQVNCNQDENVVFTDNKIYISLAARNPSLTSSTGGTSSLKKNRRIIYPTSGGYKLSGFLRDYDFNYESPTKKAAEDNSAGCDEKLKFNVMNEGAAAATSAAEVVFEKVKVKKSPGNEARRPSMFVNVTNHDEERNDDSILTSTTFVADMNSYEADDEDDVQWRNFLELRKHGKSISENPPKMTLSDSGFGSQLLSSSSTFDRNLKCLDAWLDDETYDNSFNEELEQRVSKMFPDLHKSSNTAYYNNINNTNHEKKDKFSS